MEFNNPFLKSIELIISGDSELFAIALTSIRFAAFSTIITSIFAVPLGVLLAMHQFKGKKAIIVIFNSLMALPTVVIALFVYSTLSRSGPLGHLNILYTPAAVITGQAVLIFPIIVSLVYSSVSKTDSRLPETLKTLGAGRAQLYLVILSERKSAVLSSILAGFGRVLGEIGISMMLGGNIRWYTRTMTTAIALQTNKGEFELGLALGILLMLIAFFVNFLLHILVKDE